ncbi:MAG: RNA polymerase sigma factor [Acidimicrobiia bacterium]
MDKLAKGLVSDLDSAFGTVVENMGPQLFWGLRRMCGDHQEAEDLTQETFIRAYRALSGYDERRIAAIELRPWLWTIAMNLGRNHLRDRSRRPTYVELGSEDRTDDPEPVDSAAWDRRFERLNRHQRAAVVLRHVVGMGVGEISAVTGRPEGTVKADVHRGLARLRMAMEDEG